MWSESLESPPVRRRHPKPQVPSSARDQRDRAVSDRESLSGTVDQRLDRLEHMLRDVIEALDVNGKRLNAVQAQLDHLSAKIRSI
jgi:hypothetical protein